MQSVDAGLRADAARLSELSPLFVRLLRHLDEKQLTMLFRPEASALLPDASADWVPACVSGDVDACMRHLRRCKQRGLAHIIWWELGIGGDIETSYRAIADFAAGLLDEALTMAFRLVQPRFGTLPGGRFAIIGLGKLGGRELNLGSDVDPLFVWQGEGASEGGRRSVPAHEYFGHVARMLIRLMSEHTADGIVWPMDMRLRPGGDTAAIAASLEATLDFYQNYGQTWERAMLIKARPVAGDLELGCEFVQGIQPFIYRRYLDYTTVAALAEMKVRIDRQAGAADPGPGFDVKRGRGGIREIEFVIQSRQLAHGGSSPELRLHGSLEALAALVEQGLFDAAEAESLREAYRFWRRIEHAVQARQGEQTQKLPEDVADYLSRALQPAGLGNDIHDRMQQHALRVRRCFEQHLLPHAEEETEDLWLPDGRPEALAGLDEDARRRIVQALQQIDAQLMRGLLPERSRKQIERILGRAMPVWLADANGVTAIESFADLVHGIAGRATWIDLLATHRGVLNWLIGVLSASRYLAEHIVRDPSWLEWPLATEQRRADIDILCRNLDGLHGDAEEVLSEMGRLVDRGRILVSLAVDSHEADPLTVGAWLADLADAATRAVMRLACRELGLPDDFPLVALAMGKHGSREMGLVSDLDMVFVLDCEDVGGMLGRRSMGEHAQRLGRRIIHYLSSRPPFGAGFDFDARLRPSGGSGALVTSLDGFRDYQLHQAQTWEHQALCRARAVAGPRASCEALKAVVGEVLDLPRDMKALAADVVGMRKKMLQHLASKRPGIINLKQDEGGLVDIEFLAQFARLAFGTVRGVSGRGTVEILRQLEYADVPEAWRQAGPGLAATYLDYRQMENALRVQLWRSIGRLPADAAATEWETMRRHAAIHAPDALKARMQQVHEQFRQLLDETSG